MNVQIKNRYTGDVLFECDVEESGMAMRHAVEKATEADADLRCADLSCANLRGANLCGADLSVADLSVADLCGANLRGANLRGANLRDANLCGADLRGANLCDANLCGANLCGADLSVADLSVADLRGADLRGANLCDANLRGAKNKPLVISGLRWIVQISGTGWMQIGCQKHSVSEWAAFTDCEISNMSRPDALPFWNAHKSMLLGLCDAWKHPEPTESTVAEAA